MNLGKAYTWASGRALGTPAVEKAHTWKTDYIEREALKPTVLLCSSHSITVCPFYLFCELF